MLVLLVSMTSVRRISRMIFAGARRFLCPIPRVILLEQSMLLMLQTYSGWPLSLRSIIPAYSAQPALRVFKAVELMVSPRTRQTQLSANDFSSCLTAVEIDFYPTSILTVSSSFPISPIKLSRPHNVASTSGRFMHTPKVPFRTETSPVNVDLGLTMCSLAENQLNALKRVKLKHIPQAKARPIDTTKSCISKTQMYEADMHKTPTPKTPTSRPDMSKLPTRRMNTPRTPTAS